MGCVFDGPQFRAAVAEGDKCRLAPVELGCYPLDSKGRNGMKVTEVWKSTSAPTVSFEVYPARTPKAGVSFEKALDKLVELGPDFFSVTFGAGGSTRDGSRELVRKLRQDKNQDVLAYVACFGLSPHELEEVIGEYRGLGVESVLTVRGDEPGDEGAFSPHPDSFAHASDFLRFAKTISDSCFGAACYPEGHVEAKTPEQDLEYLRQKVDLGAEFLIANYFYDNRFFFDFMARCIAKGIEVPILPGVMPIFSIRMMETLAELCGATIPDGVRDGLGALPEGDKEALTSFGVDYAVEQCRGLLKAGVPGLHFYTMDRSTSVSRILGRLRSDGLI